jgi:hypothetical protein
MVARDVNFPSGVKSAVSHLPMISDLTRTHGVLEIAAAPPRFLPIEAIVV